MTDDIVTRLREGHGQGCTCSARCYCECGCDAVWAEYSINDAADEIERLRAILEMFRKAGNHRYTTQGRTGYGWDFAQLDAAMNGLGWGKDVAE